MGGHILVYTLYYNSVYADGTAAHYENAFEETKYSGTSPLRSRSLSPKLYCTVQRVGRWPSIIRSPLHYGHFCPVPWATILVKLHCNYNILRMKLENWVPWSKRKKYYACWQLVRRII